MYMNKMRPNIAIIGAGQLGSRHLQGLKRINRKIDVTVVEPNFAAIETAKKRFNEMPDNPLVQNVNYLPDISQLSEHIDIAIIATNADIRRNIVEQMLKETDVDKMILEKVAFQSVDDFESVIERLKRKHVKAWVNCTRRMYPIYKEIKKELEHESRISFHAGGKNWGMACNSIHHIDLFSYLTGDVSIELDGSGMDEDIYKSKRGGFVEFGGYLTGRSSRSDSISLVDYKTDKGVSISLHIVCRNSEFLIHELDGIVTHAKKINAWEVKKEKFKIPFQSELTHLAIQELLDEGTSALTHLEESFMLHKPMLETFNRHLEKISKKQYNKCPIT